MKSVAVKNFSHFVFPILFFPFQAPARLSVARNFVSPQALLPARGGLRCLGSNTARRLHGAKKRAAVFQAAPLIFSLFDVRSAASPDGLNPHILRSPRGTPAESPHKPAQTPALNFPKTNASDPPCFSHPFHSTISMYVFHPSIHNTIQAA